MSLPRADLRALEKARRLTALQVDTLTHAVESIDDTVGWARLTELGTASTVRGQEAGASAAADALNAALEAVDLVGDLTPDRIPVRPGRLVSGRDVRGMFAATQDIVARRMTGGATFPEALDASAKALTGFAASEPHRVARDGALAAGLGDPRFNRYRRVAVGNTCTFCLMLATRGAVYLTAASAGQGRRYHHMCVPADTAVTSPGTEAATRRRYEGELVVIATASGKHLRITPNHPVLTDHGWVDAGSLNVGDHVVDGSRLDGQRLGVPDVDDAPALIGDVFEAIRMGGDLVRMETTAEDFYGDGRDGYVDVVRPHRSLDEGTESAGDQLVTDVLLTLGRTPRPGLRALMAGYGNATSLLVGDRATTRGGVRGSDLSRPILGAYGRCAYHAGIGATAHRDAPVADLARQTAARDSVAASYGQSGIAGHVLLDGLVGYGGSAGVAPGRSAARFDPMSAHQDWDHVRAYAQKGADLLVRVAGQIALDPVVDVRRVQWSGHVFDLQTVEGWFVADGLMVSNCDCYVELVVDQDAIARSQSLQGDWRNAVRDPERMREVGAWRPGEFLESTPPPATPPTPPARPAMTREAAERLTNADLEKAMSEAWDQADDDLAMLLEDEMERRAQWAKQWGRNYDEYDDWRPLDPTDLDDADLPDFDDIPQQPEMSRRQIRAQWEDEMESRIWDAEDYGGGIRPDMAAEAQAKGITLRTLMTGDPRTAYKYANQELLTWWDANGGRMPLWERMAAHGKLDKRTSLERLRLTEDKSRSLAQDLLGKDRREAMARRAAEQAARRRAAAGPVTEGDRLAAAQRRYQRARRMAGDG